MTLVSLWPLLLKTSLSHSAAAAEPCNRPIVSIDNDNIRGGLHLAFDVVGHRGGAVQNDDYSNIKNYVAKKETHVHEVLGSNPGTRY